MIMRFLCCFGGGQEVFFQDISEHGLATGTGYSPTAEQANRRAMQSWQPTLINHIKVGQLNDAMLMIDEGEDLFEKDTVCASASRQNADVMHSFVGMLRSTFDSLGSSVLHTGWKDCAHVRGIRRLR